MPFKSDFISQADMDEYLLVRQNESKYDYRNQAWTVDDRYVRCGHPESMNCQCYGKLHEGEEK